MNLLLSLYLAALFAAFVPGVLVTLPRGGSKMTVLAVHALLFVVVWHFTRNIVSRATEGFAPAAPATTAAAAVAAKARAAAMSGRPLRA